MYRDPASVVKEMHACVNLICKLHYECTNVKVLHRTFNHMTESINITELKSLTKSDGTFKRHHIKLLLKCSFNLQPCMQVIA